MYNFKTGEFKYNYVFRGFFLREKKRKERTQVKWCQIKISNQLFEEKDRTAQNIWSWKHKHFPKSEVYWEGKDLENELIVSTNMKNY